MADTTDLYTTVLNPTASALRYTYLGRHGKLIPAGGTYTIWGHIQHSFGFGEATVRKKKALESDLLNNRLKILKTPRVILLDASSANGVPDPTVAATVSVTGGGSAGGNLAAGHYTVSYTWVNQWGESLVGTSASTDFTVVAGNIPRITLPVRPANVDSINIYLTATGASASDTTTFRLYDSTTTTTYNASAALPVLGPANPAPPTVNTTAAHLTRCLGADDDVLGTVDPSWGAF